MVHFHIKLGKFATVTPAADTRHAEMKLVLKMQDINYECCKTWFENGAGLQRPDR